ncbi:MAG: PGPGW domain-containing protein [Mariniblastus sp.]|nr:PGPGW domain-containing protein [Mariniblastus sp.]MDG2180317.1 PGPGW domain-containing protein [Mariniblastus sp.]
MLDKYLPALQNFPWGNLVPWLVTFSLIAFVFSAFGVSIVLLRLPVDYLSNPTPSTSPQSNWKHLLSKIGRNILGSIFLIVGTVMLLTPGQGILSIVVGLMLLDFPGKLILVRKILTKPRIFRTINRMRTTAKRPPLEPHLDDSPVRND